MDRAARESGCGVPWQLLAAIARVESDFGRNMATSSAGAIGYGQFLPSSWQIFGGSDANAYDYRDALPAIALYLCQAGLARDPRRALFAYNHADWYVDMVLNLAVRYDRMAPGAPSPDVLSVGPADQAATPMHYAAGRDVQLDNRARTVSGDARWLGVPWRGRAAGQPISSEGLNATTLTILSAAFGLTTRVSQPAQDLVAAAWNGGMLALPGDARMWTTADLRLELQRGHPVVAFVKAEGLPGHPPGEDVGDQPLIVIGTTSAGFIYSDPTFSSSLGYGLELAEPDFVSAWDAASPPRQALGFVGRPRNPTQAAHLSEAAMPPAIARILPTPTPPPTATSAPPTPRPAVVAATAEPSDTVVPTPAPRVAAIRDQTTTFTSDDSFMIFVATGAVAAAALALRRARVRAS